MRGFTRLSISLRAVVLAWRPALDAIGASLLYQLGVVLVVLTLARGLGIAVAPAARLVVVPIANLSALLPISISGRGVSESAFVLGVGMVGVAATDALALSVLFGLLNMLVGICGLVSLVRRQTRPSGAV